MKNSLAFKFLVISFAGIILFSCKLFSQEKSLLMMKAVALSESGKFADAAALAESGATTHSDYRFWLLAGDFYLKAGKINESVRSYSNANMLEPGSGFTGLAIVSAATRNTGEALGFLALSMKTKFKRPERGLLLEKHFSYMENLPEWRSFWKKEWYTEAEKSLAEIKFYTAAGKSAEAADIISTMRQTYAGTEICDYAEFLTAKASGDFKSATEKIATLTVNFPQNEEYLKEKLDLFTSGGNHSSASTVAEELLRIGYSDPKLLRSLAELYLKSGDTDRSKKYIDDYLGLYPGDITALGISGRIAVAGGNSLGAIEIFNKALKVNPGNPEIWKLRGNSFFSARAWDDAVKDYSMALDLNPSDSELWLNKGIAEISKGNTETGCYDLRKALSLGNKKASPHISKSCIN